MKTTSQTNKAAAVGFWRWFAANADRLKMLYSAKLYEQLAGEMNRELDKIDSRLAWEIGGGLTLPSLLTISGEGSRELTNIAEFVVKSAPNLKDWEFYASRPARSAPNAVQFPGSAERYEASNWEFVPIERPERGRLDLIIVDDQLAAASRERALMAVSIYLDQALGEEKVEAWIGTLSVESRAAVLGKRAFKIEELPEYLLWVTHRENNPLKQTAG